MVMHVCVYLYKCVKLFKCVSVYRCVRVSSNLMAPGGWDRVVSSSQEGLHTVTTSWKPTANREPSAEKQQQPGLRWWYPPTKSHDQEAPSAGSQRHREKGKAEENIRASM